MGNASVLVFLVPMVAAFLTWFSESPRKRRYHWSLPVPRELHDAMRVAAGAFWLLAGIALFCVVGFAVEDPVMRARWLSNAWVFYGAVFVVPLMIYLLVSIPVVAFDRAPLWVALTVLLFLTLRTQTVTERLPEATDMYHAFIEPLNAFSLGAATMGSFMWFPWWDSDRRYQVAKATIDDFMETTGVPLEHRPVVKARHLGRFENGWRGDKWVRDRQKWIPSLLVWYAIALLGLTLAVRRRPDV
jgi:hypothetical protein